MKVFLKVFIAAALGSAGAYALSLDDLFSDPAFDDIKTAAKSAVSRFQGYMDAEMQELKQVVQNGELTDDDLPKKIAGKVQEVATEFFSLLRGSVDTVAAEPAEPASANP